MIKNTRTHYGSLAKLFHWFVFCAILAMFSLGFGAGFVHNTATVGLMFTVHKSLGLTLLLIMLGRLWWRVINTTPGYRGDTKAWERLAAKTLHWGFYLAIFAMLATGWVTTSTGKHGVSFWGLFDARLPMAQHKALHHLTSGWHTLLAWTLIAMLALHILAALKHHYINKDDVLTRMMPGAS